ncbi:MAG: hypothetical protein EPO62_03490 [Candidatus Nitrosotenuis sp.]|nr:MAG: hypothetical protein EPO62_03490 [Candidatus Nitrosotenuis sp.]
MRIVVHLLSLKDHTVIMTNPYARIGAVTGIFFLGLMTLLSVENAYAKTVHIDIPFGDHDKNLRTVIELYSQINHNVDVGDTISWLNDDQVSHTVTSGKGAGLSGFVGSSEQGKPDGYFSSGVIESGKSWSFTFTKTGFFTYFCEIHPWIERSITVNEPGIDITQEFRLTYTALLTIVIVLVASIATILLIKRVKNKKS